MDINQITYQINGAIFEVNRELGAGFLEKVYEQALLIELLDRGLKAESQVPIKVVYKGKEVGEYYSDIVVENQVIIEKNIHIDQTRAVAEIWLPTQFFLDIF